MTAFFKLANIIPEEHAIELMKAAAKATYGKKGDKIVQMNYDAIDAGAKEIVEINVPEAWKNAEDEGLFTPEIKGGRKLEKIKQNPFVKKVGFNRIVLLVPYSGEP